MRLKRESRQAAPGDRGPTARSWNQIGRRNLLVLAAGLVAAVVLVLVVLAGQEGTPPLDRAQVGTIASGVVEQALEKQQSAPATSALVYQQILPSLVRIETEGSLSEDTEGGLGTGVIVNANGSIMTAFHVVQGAGNIRVTFVDGTRSDAELTTADPANDIAVLTPSARPEVIVPAVLGGGGQVGDAAFAVGHPLGYSGSLSTGVISGLDRTVNTEEGTRLSGLIQFDAAVNPGSSGGPLLNRGGQVIGIVTGIANEARDGYFIGIGFAVPIGTAGGAANTPPK